MTPTGYSAQPTKYEYYSYETSEGANGGVRASEWKITEYNPKITKNCPKITFGQFFFIFGVIYSCKGKTTKLI